jgi:co-chaperonin GroES (HSP10)
MTAPIAPNGFNVLVLMDEVKSTSAGGIILSNNDVERHQEACDVGTIMAFGPIAYRGFSGCNPNEYPPLDPRYKMEPNELWGVKVGDKVEYRRHEGKLSGQKGCELYRYIPDSMIIGTVSEVSE